MLSQPTADMYTPKKLSYKLVGDNIDKKVKSRYMRLNGHRNKSFHYFHSFAVQNRIDISSLLDVLPHGCPNHPCKVALGLLSSAQDDKALRQHFVTLISRVLYTHIPFFNFSFDGVIDWHKKHKYYQQMCSKSVVVSTCMCFHIVQYKILLYTCTV